MYYNTRAQFTRNDVQFIADALGSSQEDRSAILRMAEDPSARATLLHEKRLFESSLRTPPALLSISPHLFFYIFVYRALDYKHIADDDVADYVAGICVEFRGSQPLWQVGSTEGGKMVYMVDLLRMLGDLDKPQQYFLKRYIGNVSLFLTGFFPDFIFQRSQNVGAPPMEYYERVGRAQFESAAGDSGAYDADAAPVLNVLAEQFVEVRSAINIFTDAYLNLESKNSLNRIQRQAATLDEDDFRRTLEL